MTLKRTIDVVVGSTLALLALPFILVLAVGCAIALRAWPFFVQRRVGKDGREFAMPKLRTLRPWVPGDATKYDLDPTHIPAYCQFLRRTHLDELPQLALVPLGFMSLVGPRPEMPCLMSRYPADVVARRTSLRPGCTGLWQVSGASVMLIHESPEFDLAYIEHCNNRLDAWILFRTALIAITGRADATLAGIPSWAYTATVRTAPSVGGTFDPVDSADAVIDLAFYEELEAMDGLRPLSVDIDG